MFFSLTAVELKSILLCRKQTFQRFIFFNGLEIKRASKCPLETQFGVCVTRRLFLTSAENWDCKSRSEALGLCLHEAKTSVWEVIDAIKLAGYCVYTIPKCWVGQMSSTNPEVKEKKPERTTERSPSGEEEAKGPERGRRGLVQGPRTKEGTEQSQMLGTNLGLRDSPKPMGGDPNMASSWNRRSHWVVRFSE